ncbi:MAG TPA: preprotein translocase subunit YajC [Acidimicrobiales bacterium]|nr:preprotein translocase subunit YajC [Acidimicrobiales bacterium]
MLLLGGIDLHMHFMNSLSHMVVASTTSTTTKASTSSGSYFLLVIVALFAVLYFVMIRPNQRRRVQAMRQARSYDLGDEVVAAGMVGHVVRIGDGEVDVEVSDGVVVQFVPQAVQLRSTYMQSSAGRGMGAGRPGGFGGFGGASSAGNAGGSSGRSTYSTGTAGSTASEDEGPYGATGSNAIGSRARSVRRRSSASDAWPEVGATGLGSGADGGGSSAGGAGTSDGGVAPAGEK